MKYRARLKTPTVLQMEASECGAAALGIILAYYGRFIPLEELRVACGVSRDGSKAINLLSAARKYGLKADAVQAETEDLETLSAPTLVFWKFNHFIIVENIDEHKVYINDPATGPRTISRQEFNEGFTGVALIFEPSKQFKKQGSAPSVLEGLKRRLQTEYGALSFVLLASILLVIPGILIPGFSKIFIDEILIRGMTGWLPPLILGMVVVGSLQAGLMFLQQNYLLNLQIKFMLTGATRFIWHVLHLPLSFFYQRFAGDIFDRISANDRVAGLLSTEVTASIVSVLTMFFYGFVMLLLSWQLACIGFLSILASTILLIIISRKIADTNRHFLQEQGRLSGIEMNGLRMIETLKANASEDAFFKSWANMHANLINAQQKIAVYSQTLLIIPQALTGLTSVAIVCLGSLLVIRGQLTLGTLVAFQALLINFNSPIMTLLGVGNSLQQIRGDLARLDDALNCAEDQTLLQENSIDVDDTHFKGALDINKLTFGYSTLEKPLLKDFELSIKPGMRVAIVGKTGSGKSTLLNLVTGLYQPWTGDIRLDNNPILSYSRKQLSRIISFVSQEIFLFEGSLRDNLSLWNKDFSDKQLYSAIKAVFLDELFDKNSGLDAHIDEGGTNLSGGQRQRIEIARALVENPSLLILDEAMANLDSALEKKIYDNLSKRQCTTIIITHRLHAIYRCDHIIVLEQGEIVEQGTHEQLMQQKNHYHTLFTTGD